MTLKECTKEELIFVIKRLQMYSLSDGHYIRLALLDVEEERERKNMTRPGSYLITPSKSGKSTLTCWCPMMENDWLIFLTRYSPKRTPP